MAQWAHEREQSRSLICLDWCLGLGSSCRPIIGLKQVACERLPTTGGWGRGYSQEIFYKKQIPTKNDI